MTIKELNKYLNKYVKIEIDKDVYIGTLEINEYHNTDINLSNLDFSDFDGNIKINNLKVRKQQAECIYEGQNGYKI